MFAAQVAQNVFFGIIAAVMIIGGLRVVTTRNVVHAAMWLVVVLAGMAGQFILLSAEFVATTQVLVYIGAVVVLFLFGTMLTRAKQGHEDQLTYRHWPIAAVTAVFLLGVVGYVLVDEFGDEELPEGTEQLAISSTEAISDAIFKPYLLPFWALSFVLLAALVGAIVLARRD
jgi:NADH-quinone oxidoreductase subunit J